MRNASAPGPNLDYFKTRGTPNPTLTPLDPSSPELQEVLDHFDPRRADEDAERQVLWLREQVARHASDSSILAALDRITAWEKKVRKLRAFADDPEQMTANAGNLDAKRLLARFWVHQFELERAAILCQAPPFGRILLNDRIRFRVETGNWESPPINRMPKEGESLITTYHSSAFPHAKAAVEAFMAAAPNDAEAYFRAFQLYRYTDHPDSDAAKQAAALSGPYAAAARVYVLTTDARVGNLLAEAGSLRGGHYSNRTVVSQGVLTSTPKGNLMVVPQHTGPTAQELARANQLEAQANALAAEEDRELQAAVAGAPASEPMFRMLAEFTGMQNNFARMRIIEYALELDPSDWRVYELLAEFFADQPHLKDHERAADAAQMELRTEANQHPLMLYQQQVQYNYDLLSWEMARRAVRRNPAAAAENDFLAEAMKAIGNETLDGVPIIPDAAHAVLQQYKLVELECRREMNHPEDTGWSHQVLQQQIDHAREEITSIERQTGAQL